MVLLEKLWDDVLAGPQPEKGLGKLRKLEGEGGDGSNKYKRSLSMPASPMTPAAPVTPSSSRNENVWRSVFNPGSNLATKSIGSDVFDKPQPNTPTVYDWLYSGNTKSEHR